MSTSRNRVNSSRYRSRDAHAAGSVSVALALLVFAGAVSAEISQVPLTVTASVKPNVALIVDDSGSMDFETLFQTNDGSLWWNGTTRDFWGLDTGSGGQAGFNFNPSGASSNTWRKYVYLFPNGTGTGNRSLNDASAHFAIPPTREYGFARSSDYNAAFYNPNNTYEPWPNGGGFVFANANPSAVRSDPVFGGATMNLTANIDSAATNWTFRLFQGMRRADGTLATGTVNNERFNYFPATYYQRVNAPAAYSIAGQTFNCATPDPAAYDVFAGVTGANETAMLASFTAINIHALAPDGGCLRRYEIKPGNTFPSGRSYNDEIQNFANWFQYHRKRTLALRNGEGRAFSQAATMRVGAVRINDLDPLIMWDIDNRRDDLLNFLYRTGASGGTPNREALNFVRGQFQNNSDVIQLSCQQNFTLQFTDGFSQLWTGAGVGNADSGDGVPFSDGFSETLADIAMGNFKGPFRTDIERGKVPVAPQCSSANPPVWLDCNRDPHVNHFGITLGARGNIFGVSHNRVRDAHDNPPTWQNPNVDRSPIQVDDLYHAAVNGRGEMLNAQSSDELTAILEQALRVITENVFSATASTAANSTRLNADTLIFQARFNSIDWSGEVLAFEINPDGSIGNLRWNSNSGVPAHASRNITVGRGNLAPAAFRWDQLTAAQQAALNIGSGGVPDGLGAQRVDWLRGANTGEIRNGGPFRDRTRLFGDIVNSAPSFVAAANFGYDRLPVGSPGRDSYQSFRASNQLRRRMVYIGANDGMLHALDAETGVEQWAHIPTELVTNLARLSDPNYRHRFYMDGHPIVGDAYLNSAWKTVLVAPTGAGGRSVVAIDVTDPENLGAGSVMWEFSHPDLGSVIGRPSIARMANGEWAAIFSNGYDVDRPARLFVVRLEDGSLIRTISTVRTADEASAPANGLSPPFPVDLNGDAIADLIYAGDLFGNLWKFDVSANNAAAWGVMYSAAGRPRPLTTVCASGDVAGPFDCPADQRQPITGRPVAGLGPGVGIGVYFGTGKFFEVGDNLVSASDVRQSFYAIFDQNTGGDADRVAGRSQLKAQNIVDEVAAFGQEFRLTSNLPLDPSYRGWLIDLVSPVRGFESERVVSDPVLRAGRVIFTTLIPDPDPCEAGGSSWLMELETFSGGRPGGPVLDINGDGKVDAQDLIGVTDPVTGDQEGVPPSGRRSEVGIVPTPSIVEGPNIEHKITSGTTGGLESVGESSANPRGRQSWRQRWP